MADDTEDAASNEALRIRKYNDRLREQLESYQARVKLFEARQALRDAQAEALRQKLLHAEIDVKVRRSVIPATKDWAEHINQSLKGRRK